MPRTDRLSWRPFQLAMVFVDGAAVLGGLRIAYSLRYDRVLPSGVAHPIGAFPPEVLWPMAAAWMVALWAFGLYQRDNTVSGVDEYRRVANASLVTTVVLIVGAFLSVRVDLSRGFLVIALFLVTTLLWLGRFGLRRIVYVMAKRSRHLDRLIIVGANRQAVAVAQRLLDSRAASSQVVGFLSEYVPVGTHVLDGLDILGEPLEVERVARAVGANKVVIIESGLSWESLRHLVGLMHSQSHLRLAMVPGMFDMHATAMTPHDIGPVLTLVPAPSRVVGIEAGLKRGLDLSLGGIGLILALPIMGGLALSNMVRTGRSGLVSREFLAGHKVLRLRHFEQPSRARGLHLSRLPDLFLVVSGKMSLLGPRPVIAAERHLYEAALPFLAAARPGFIGPWWVAGAERPADVGDELAYDLYYLRNYSIWLDFQILAHVAAAILGRGHLFAFEVDEHSIGRPDTSATYRASDPG